MPVFHNVALCAASDLALSVCVGLPLARLLVAERSLAMALAPIVGWAVFAALSLPILSWVGLTPATTAIVCGLAILGGLAAWLRYRYPKSRGMHTAAGVSAWSLAAAALVAALPALAVWPKRTAAGITLAEPMFDHSKVAIIDDIARLGLPPGNPFFATPGAGHSRLAYYYLWHFDAAIPSVLLGVSGWEADIALTWFTAFASLALMIGLAVRLGGRGLAAPLVVLLSLSASLLPLLRLVVPAGLVSRALSQEPWPQSWIFQASWVPQHLASASCVVIAVAIMARLPSPGSWPVVPLLAAVVAAGFESSTWVGGVVFAAAAPPIGVALLLIAETRRARLDLVLKAAVAIVLVAAVSYPFLRDEYLATAARGAGIPIALGPLEVLGPMIPANARRALDLPAYWIILLTLQFPAIYFAGGWAIARAQFP